MQQRNSEAECHGSSESRQHCSSSLGPRTDKRSQSSPLDSYLIPTVAQDRFPEHQGRVCVAQVFMAASFWPGMWNYVSFESPTPGQPHYTLAKHTHSSSSWLTHSQLLVSISSARRSLPGKNASYPSCQRECPDGALETSSSRDCLASPPAQPQNGSLALLANPALWVLCWEPCVLDCDSQVSVPDLRLSTHPHCARYTLPQHAARPGTQLQFSGTFIRPFNCGNT